MYRCHYREGLAARPIPLVNPTEQNGRERNETKSWKFEKDKKLRAHKTERILDANSKAVDQ